MIQGHSRHKSVSVTNEAVTKTGFQTLSELSISKSESINVV